VTQLRRRSVLLQGDEVHALHTGERAEILQRRRSAAVRRRSRISRPDQADTQAIEGEKPASPFRRPPRVGTQIGHVAWQLIERDSEQMSEA
jgi:hypothetical protein